MRRLLQRIARRQEGTTIVTAIALMSAMLITGMASYTVLDTQQTSSARDRQREGSFNYAEAVLNTQAFILSRQWPGNAAVNYADCQQGTSSGFCPQAAQLTASAKGADFNSGVEWKSSVRDDVSGSHYDATVANAAHWDANNNDRIWIRAQAKVRGRTRTLVELVQVQQIAELLPKRAIIAGHFDVTNNGKKIMIATNPDATSGHPVTVRCNPSSSGCAEYDRNKGQIDPDGAVVGPEYVGKPVLDADVRERLRERAIADGTFHTGCPSAAQLSGKVVWVENCTTSYTSNSVFNSAADPGMLIWNNGTLTLKGTSDFYGVIYHTNQANSSGMVVVLGGATTIHGGVYIDGNGGIDVGSNKVNIDYMNASFDLIGTYGAAGLVQNSWREIPTAQY
jgi:hypothetical protein